MQELQRIEQEISVNQTNIKEAEDNMVENDKMKKILWIEMRLLATGDNCIRNVLLWTNFSSQIQKILRVIHGCSLQQSFLTPLAEGLIEAILFKTFVSNSMTDNVNQC